MGLICQFVKDVSLYSVTINLPLFPIFLDPFLSRRWNGWVGWGRRASAHWPEDREEKEASHGDPCLTCVPGQTATIKFPLVAVLLTGPHILYIPLTSTDSASAFGVDTISSNIGCPLMTEQYTVIEFPLLLTPGGLLHKLNLGFDLTHWEVFVFFLQLTRYFRSLLHFDMALLGWVLCLKTLFGKKNPTMNKHNIVKSFMYV